MSNFDDLQDELGFCACGAPELSAAYIRDGLTLIDHPPAPEGREAFEAWYKVHKAACDLHFKSSGAEYFFYYWFDKEGLTEHGGSVPGWLLPKGEDLLRQLRELLP
jgi:hypothetical protein